jgi:hypothetical protein
MGIMLSQQVMQRVCLLQLEREREANLCASSDGSGAPERFWLCNLVPIPASTFNKGGWLPRTMPCDLHPASIHRVLPAAESWVCGVRSVGIGVRMVGSWEQIHEHLGAYSWVGGGRMMTIGGQTNGHPQMLTDVPAMCSVKM